MHSQFSGDSEAPQEEMIATAIEKGLAGICFTDHLDIDYPEEPNIFLLDWLTVYRDKLNLYHQE
jgi:histidinol-phosphatase (PHP family)